MPGPGNEHIHLTGYPGIDTVNVAQDSGCVFPSASFRSAPHPSGQAPPSALTALPLLVSLIRTVSIKARLEYVQLSKQFCFALHELSLGYTFCLLCRKEYIGARSYWGIK